MTRRRRRRDREDDRRLEIAKAAQRRAEEANRVADQQLARSKQIGEQAKDVAAESARWHRENNIASAVTATFTGPGLVELIRKRLPWPHSSSPS